VVPAERENSACLAMGDCRVDWVVGEDRITAESGRRREFTRPLMGVASAPASWPSPLPKFPFSRPLHEPIGLGPFNHPTVHSMLAR